MVVPGIMLLWVGVCPYSILQQWAVSTLDKSFEQMYPRLQVLYLVRHRSDVDFGLLNIGDRFRDNGGLSDFSTLVRYKRLEG